MAKPEIPDKLFFKIGEVCEITELEAFVLRFWETEFPGLAPEKSKTGHRVYRKKDVETLLRIKELLYERGFTIAGARKQLSMKTLRPKKTAPSREQILTQVRDELRDILTILEKKT